MPTTFRCRMAPSRRSHSRQAGGSRPCRPRAVPQRRLPDDSGEKDHAMTETYECFRVEVSDHVATVTLARPPVNAQNRRFREEIITIFDLLSDRTDVRAVVLTGEGKTFSAGADLKERPTLGEP